MSPEPMVPASALADALKALRTAVPWIPAAIRQPGWEYIARAERALASAAPADDWTREVRSLLGQRVVVTLEEEPQRVETVGELLQAEESGQVCLRGGDGFVSWSWPALHIRGAELGDRASATPARPEPAELESATVDAAAEAACETYHGVGALWAALSASEHENWWEVVLAVAAVLARSAGGSSAETGGEMSTAPDGDTEQTGKQP